MRIRSTIFAACIAMVGIQPDVLYACGYDSPQTIALGSLNWVYPDALYVVSAAKEAEKTGLLPPDRGPQSGAFAFYRATAAMKSFSAILADPHLAETRGAISVVLLPQVMWTRYQIAPEGVTVQGHAEGPLDDDLVVVTEEKVVRALLDEKLDLATAEENGLFRFYGQPEFIAKVRATLTGTSGAGRALPARLSGAERMPNLRSPDAEGSTTPATF